MNKKTTVFGVGKLNGTVKQRIENYKKYGTKEFFSQEGLNTVGEFILGDANEVAKTWDKGELGLIFIDGDHSYEGCKKDIESWLPFLKQGGYMLFHDYDLPTSPGVVRAVDELVKNSNKFIDFFVGKEIYQMATSIVGGKKI